MSWLEIKRLKKKKKSNGGIRIVYTLSSLCGFAHYEKRKKDFIVRQQTMVLKIGMVKEPE